MDQLRLFLVELQRRLEVIGQECLHAAERLEEVSETMHSDMELHAELARAWKLIEPWTDRGTRLRGSTDED